MNFPTPTTNGFSHVYLHTSSPVPYLTSAWGRFDVLVNCISVIDVVLGFYYMPQDEGSSRSAPSGRATHANMHTDTHAHTRCLAALRFSVGRIFFVVDAIADTFSLWLKSSAGGAVCMRKIYRRMTVPEDHIIQRPSLRPIIALVVMTLCCTLTL